MTTQQIIASVRLKVLEATSEVVSDTTIIGYANFALQDVYKRAFPNSLIETATLTFTNGVADLPSNFGTLYGDAYTNTNDIFPELSIADFNEKTLSQAVTIEKGQLKIYPVDKTPTINIKYYAKPTTLTANVDPTIDEYLHECLVYGTLYRVLEDLQDENLSQFYFNKYESLLSQKIANLSNYEEGNQRDGQMFNYQQLI